MPEGIDVIIIDDDPEVCEGLTRLIQLFYVWGNVLSFSDADEATAYCLSQPHGLAVFVVDVFLGEKSGLKEDVGRFFGDRGAQTAHDAANAQRTGRIGDQDGEWWQLMGNVV